MAGTKMRGPELKEPGYEIFIGVLTLLSLVNIVLMYAIDDPGLDAVLLAMNGLLSGSSSATSSTDSSRPLGVAATSSGASAGPTSWRASRSPS